MPEYKTISDGRLDRLIEDYEERASAWEMPLDDLTDMACEYRALLELRDLRAPQPCGHEGRYVKDGKCIACIDQRVATAREALASAESPLVSESYDSGFWAGIEFAQDALDTAAQEADDE